ncbi:MAG: YhcH/YjgK/YiaL family protein [Bacteroidota bacterium]|nr:YhcH/YjgK/YiaL family protein [Bacteroidota bacterium]
MISSITYSALAQQKEWTEKSAKKWVKSKQWAEALPVNVHRSVNALEFERQYKTNKEYWDKAFAFMKDKNLKELPVGKYLIDGDNVYATITDGPEKEFEKTAWESHRKYIDIQYVIIGKEKIGVESLANATVSKPYDETKDFANYTAKGKFYIATPAEFLLFFPSDVHRPNIKVDGFDTAKKLVIKIRCAN